MKEKGGPDRNPTKHSEIMLIHQLGLQKVKPVIGPAVVNYPPNNWFYYLPDFITQKNFYHDPISFIKLLHMIEKYLIFVMSFAYFHPDCLHFFFFFAGTNSQIDLKPGFKFKF